MNRLRVRYIARQEARRGGARWREARIEVVDGNGEVLGLLSAAEARIEHRAGDDPVLHLELPVLGDHEISVDTGS